MYHRDEHILESLLAGVCVRCGEGVDVRDEWHRERKYKIADCVTCGLHESALIEKI